MKQTCLKRYGVECVSQLEENKEKMKHTCLKKYGVESVTQIREYQEKREQTNLIKYGVKNGFQSKDIIEKSEQTRLIKYGVKHATQSIIFLQKREQTWLNKYGVNNPTQNAEISEKTKKYKQKEFIFPDNVIINVQGYEHWALEELVNQGFTSNTIITSRTQVPEIWYFNGKNHRYFVDIYLPDINKMIEVKSTWTFKLNNELIIKKAQECIKQGHDYEIWI